MYRAVSPALSSPLINLLTRASSDRYYQNITNSHNSSSPLSSNPADDAAGLFDQLSVSDGPQGSKTSLRSDTTALTTLEGGRPCISVAGTFYDQGATIENDMSDSIRSWTLNGPGTTAHLQIVYSGTELDNSASSLVVATPAGQQYFTLTDLCPDSASVEADLWITTNDDNDDNTYTSGYLAFADNNERLKKKPQGVFLWGIELEKKKDGKEVMSFRKV